MNCLIKNSLVVDGTGGEPYKADVEIKDDRIIKISAEIDEQGKKVIDGRGYVLTPGFIDIHTHSDLFMLDQRRDPVNLSQGVTTEVAGNCGFSPAPLEKKHQHLLEEYAVPVMGRSRKPWTWEGFGCYTDLVSKGHYVNNWGSLVGNGAIRIAIKGFSEAPMSSREMDRAGKMLEEALDAGAAGLSLGLMYVPEFFCRREELLHLCRVLNKKNKFLTAHIRGEGRSLESSVREILELGREGGIPVHISHLKAAGLSNWDSAIDRTLELIDRCRQNGQDVTCDLYPYEASSTILSSLLPPWVLNGGNAKAVERLNIRDEYLKALEHLKRDDDQWDNLVFSTGWDRVVISSAPPAMAAAVCGRTVREISERRNEEPDVTALNLFREAGGEVGIIFYSMCRRDMEKIIARDYSFFISDTLYPPEGFSHPRGFGSFSRIIQDYVVKDGLLTLPEAVRKMTSLPAARVGLADRGILKEGFVADLLLFKPEEIESPADFGTPRQISKGMKMVILGGDIVLENNKASHTERGRFLRINTQEK